MLPFSMPVHGGPTWLRNWHRRLSQASPEQLRAVAIAQFLSFLLCITGITSGVLAGKGINAPATQALVNYAAIAATCSAIHYVRGGHRWRLSNAWYIYAGLAFLDVQGNFLVTKAYQYTSITSVTLLDCFTIPAVMALSWLVFRSRYSAQHLLGAGLCVLGLAVLVVTDRQSETGGPNPLLGDALVILGATVYAVCNVAQEHLLVNTSQWELLAMIGSFGSGFAGLQALILERKAWYSAQWDAAAVAALLGFGGALYCFYTLVPTVLHWGGSTVLNLSLLTSDLWAAGARAVMFGGFGGSGPSFAVALVAEAAGIALYTLAGDTHSVKQQQSVSAEETGPLLPCPGQRESVEDGELVSAQCLLGERNRSPAHTYAQLGSGSTHQHSSPTQGATTQPPSPHSTCRTHQGPGRRSHEHDSMPQAGSSMSSPGVDGVLLPGRHSADDWDDHG